MQKNSLKCKLINTDEHLGTCQESKDQAIHLFCQGAPSSTSFPQIQKDPFHLNKHEGMTSSVINKEIYQTMSLSYTYKGSLERVAVRDYINRYLYGVVHS